MTRCGLDGSVLACSFATALDSVRDGGARVLWYQLQQQLEAWLRPGILHTEASFSNYKVLSDILLEVHFGWAGTSADIPAGRR